MFKSETTSFHYFSPRIPFPICKIIGHPISGSGGKKTFKWYFKSEQTDGQTHRQMDISTYRKNRPRGLMLWKSTHIFSKKHIFRQIFLTNFELSLILNQQCEFKDIKFGQVKIKLIALGWYLVIMIFWFWGNPEIHCSQAMHNVKTKQKISCIN